MKKLEETGLVQLSESFYRPSRIHFSIDKKKLYDFQVANAKFDPLIKTLLRLYGGELFAEFIPISESQLAKVLKQTTKDISTDLMKLGKLQLLNYEPASDKPMLTFVLSRQDLEHLPIDKAKMEERRALIFQKKDAMVHYATQNHRCRMEVVQEYFNEDALIPCGICDVCIERRKKENESALRDYREQIFYLLKKKPMTVEELETGVAPNDQDLFVEVVREMVDSEVIAYDEFWVLRMK